MESINVPGKIISQSHDGCIATIGPVSASMTRATLQAMVTAVEEIDRKIGASPLAVVGPSFELRNGWIAVAWERDRKCYVFNLRGVAWNVLRSDVDSFVRDAAMPFLARGTASKLLQRIEGAVDTGTD
ncbi:hypothetical protein LMG28727_06218 [Paraburkholderia kirstenboschensis]|uniref:hypothetical protein n=1 Tax=Paraburkholderia TaxID=1822464 RepID=UPI000AF3AEEB|nr:hypothetical protein [Paraburkholderia kirstenboschensis]CAD6556872.1 hypothetical protein LMG28727_06218 [Paraburkholderia kirstenboschensis]